MSIRDLKFLETNRDEDMHSLFDYHAKSSQASNIFNPSFVFKDNVEIFSFRGIPMDAPWHEDSLHSFISIKRDDPKSVTTTNLSRLHAGVFGSPRIIDPKLFEVDGNVYATFNSGHVPGGNDIFVMKVYPEMGSPIKVVYEGRQDQERNWGFYAVGGRVFCLYSVDPLRILYLDKETESTWVMKDHFEARKSYFDGYSIGTQPLWFEDSHCAVLHKKIIKDKKKIYLGRMCTFNHDMNIAWLSRSFLVHSLDSIFGNQNKWNKNLYSCTYFSGLMKGTDNSLKVGYGINDIDVGFASVIKGVL